MPSKWPTKGIHGGSTVGSLGWIFLPDAYRKASTKVMKPMTIVVALGAQLKVSDKAMLAPGFSSSFWKRRHLGYRGQ